MSSLFFRKTMGTLSIVVSDRSVRHRLAEALGNRFRLVNHEGWRDFEERVRSIRPRVVIVDPYSASGPPTIECVLAVADHSEVGIVVCADFSGRAADLYAVGLAGIPSYLKAPELGSRQEIEQAVERAIATSVAKAVVARLQDRAPPLALNTLRWAVGHATQDTTAEDLARALSASPKSLGNQLRKNKLPPVRRTMLWGRLLYAAWSLHEGDENIEALARRLGYSTRSGLTKALSEAVGAPPSQLAVGDPRTPVLDAYLNEIYAA